VDTDTIFALASGHPPAAIAVVRVSGPRAHDAATRLARQLPPLRQASLRTLINPADGDVIDQALLLRFDAPASATGENIVEFHCHGGRAVVDALLGALAGIDGFRLAKPGEFTRRALANGRIDLTEAEGLADLLEAETELQRRTAMARAGGALRARLDGWRDRLLSLSARAEVAIDYADEEEGLVELDLSDDLLDLCNDMSTLLAAPRVEPMREGIRVVVAGPPNAGKSSLINALTKIERSIVTAIPGTTRDIIEVPLAIEGAPFVLIDTAGLRDSDDEVEAIGIDRARAELDRADIVLWLGPSERKPHHRNILQVAAKADTGKSDDPCDVATSSVTGQGLVELANMLVARAKEILPWGSEVALNRRQHDLVVEAEAAIHRASQLGDPVLIAEELRIARYAVDRIGGRAGVEELLDALFGRFCLGK